MTRPRQETGGADTPTTWADISLQGTPETLDALSAYLVDLGSPAVVSPDGPESAVRGCLPDDGTLPAALADLRRYLRSLERMGFHPVRVQIRSAPTVDWVREFERTCVPTTVGPFRIEPGVSPPGAPPRRRGVPEPVQILLTPGMAFGTGEHPTTRLCLEALGTRAGRMAPARVLDIGCGSGILGIAAAKCFPRCRVIAVDTDPDACRTARGNVRRNRVRGRIQVRKGSVERTRGTFGLILANLYLTPLRALARSMAARLPEGGVAILSGLLARQIREYRQDLRAAGLAPVEQRTRAGWSCLTVVPERV